MHILYLGYELVSFLFIQFPVELKNILSVLIRDTFVLRKDKNKKVKLKIQKLKKNNKIIQEQKEKKTVNWFCIVCVSVYMCNEFFRFIAKKSIFCFAKTKKKN